LYIFKLISYFFVPGKGLLIQLHWRRTLVQQQLYSTIKENEIFCKDIKLCRKGNRNIDMEY